VEEMSKMEEEFGEELFIPIEVPLLISSDELLHVVPS
jgi:hypothetical protein